MRLELKKNTNVIQLLAISTRKRKNTKSDQGDCHDEINLWDNREIENDIFC